MRPSRRARLRWEPRGRPIGGAGVHLAAGVGSGAGHGCQPVSALARDRADLLIGCGHTPYAAMRSLTARVTVPRLGLLGPGVGQHDDARSWHQSDGLGRRSPDRSRLPRTHATQAFTLKYQLRLRCRRRGPPARGSARCGQRWPARPVSALCPTPSLRERLPFEQSHLEGVPHE